MFRYLPESREIAIETAKRLVVDSIWKTANIELAKGITFPETLEIFEGRVPNNVDVNTVLVVNNLKHSWQFLVEAIDYPFSLELVSRFNHLIEEGKSRDAGKLRSSTVFITGTDYVPLIPSYQSVQDTIQRITEIDNPIDRALEVFCEISRGQWFMDGNKRTAQLVANFILLQAGAGIFAIPTDRKKEFIEELIHFYESGDRKRIKTYLYDIAVGMLPSGLPLKKLVEVEPNVVNKLID